MEEVDSIILHFLRQLNVDISEDVKSICELSVEVIIASAARCLSEINNLVKVPQKLPSGISHRIEVASQIASLCKDLGYKNDVGYQTFLYYNEADLRQVFMFLIESLPNEGKNSAVRSTTTNKESLLYQEISCKIGEDLNSIWIPPCCNSVSKNVIGDILCDSALSSACYKNEIMHTLLQLKNNSFNSLDTKSSPTDHFSEEIVVKYASDKPLKQLKEEAILLRQKFDTLESKRHVMDVEYSQAQKACEKIEADTKSLQNILESIGITDIDQDGATDNLMNKVQNNLCLLHKKSEQLTSKSLSLKVEIDKIRNSMDSNQSERSKCKQKLTILKENAKSMKDEYGKNEETKNMLKKSYEKSKGGNKRSVYTKRILEIISNVEKQNSEINKILEDTRQLQKEINTLEGQLDRCFSIADETLFRDAKKDDQAKKAYKLLALLHSECNTIVSLVNDTGSIARDIVDLEDNIKTEKSKKTEETLKKIHLDLTKMQQESNIALQ